MKKLLLWVVLTILALIPLSTYAIDFSNLNFFKKEVVIPISSKTEQVEVKTFDSEIDRLSIKYNVSSTTAKAIIKCESTMYGKAINENIDSSGSVWSRDFGYFQVNDYYHESTMARLGLDIHDQWDSLEYGFMLLKEQGTKPWKASLPCWSKVI
jgi:hypothetical protein